MKPTNTENQFYFKGTFESKRKRNTQNYWTLVPLKLQVKPAFEYFLEMPQAVKEGKAGKGPHGISDLRIKERKAEVARDFSGFHDSVVTSTALWPSGFDLKGWKTALSGQSSKLQQVPCDGKTPAVSVSRFFRKLPREFHRPGREFRKIEGCSETATFLLLECHCRDGHNMPCNVAKASHLFAVCSLFIHF